jgi:hypothetical protein
MTPDDWSVHQLRMTLFSSEPFPVSESGWRLLTGQDEAENRVNVPGGRQYSGKVFDSLLALTIVVNRIDIVLAFDPSKLVNISTASAAPIIGPWLELSALFGASVESFLQDLTAPVIRLAFGANLLGVVSSRTQTYEELAKLLKSVVVDVRHMRELFFRINWPQISSVVPGLEINRLTGWSSLIFSQNILQNTGSELIVSQAGQGPSYAVSLEIDHNTALDRKDRFENRHLVPIFRELVTLANENVRGGERP